MEETKQIDISAQREMYLRGNVEAIQLQRSVILEFLALAQRLAQMCDTSEKLANFELEQLYEERKRVEAQIEAQKKADEEARKKAEEEEETEVADDDKSEPEGEKTS
jgi:hypothetical protein